MNTIMKEMIDIAKEAGIRIKNDRDFSVSEKTDAANIVTTMDTQIQNFILGRLEQLLPEAKVIAEEDNVHSFDNGYVWIVDPIDGTTNYAYDCKHSCISIALLNENDGYIGVVYNPYLDELFYAKKGEGSFLNGKPLNVTDCSMNESLVIMGTAPYRKDKADYTFEIAKRLFVNGRDIRRSGSAVLDLCYVACGRYDAFFEADLAVWDRAAAALIISEAGGIVEAIEPDVWNYERSIGVIAGNKNNIKDLKALVKP
ncbi:inositol monophosphatase family protein [Breznakia pachnodae]|uniref:Inositol-1-monophosphatase n=1 Tax=Breznakia pachnodae TaxID=265178 RepID=A0ABU0E8L4_9FIRM|nr:inositol monophosphatase family protein [Breznakia pachnodae]MDQ0363217.1 myo-inositol-1(or 4)-monophosphatase [Breznakia pachnodae]